MATAVKENGILFQGPMVRAILDDKKTQTRRILDRVKGFGKVLHFGESNTPGYDYHFRCRRGLWQDFRKQELIDRCPYGRVGDRLWVREAWSIVPHVTEDGPKNKAKGDGTGVTWRAAWDGNPSGFKWKPSIHMPRFASRINLEIVRVRVERVRDISREDAIAEGIFLNDNDWWDTGTGLCGELSPESAFRELWASIHGSDSWTNNPWVWVVEFKKVSP